VAVAQPEQRMPTLLGRAVERIKRHPSLVLWLNKNVPASVRSRLKRRL